MLIVVFVFNAVEGYKKRICHDIVKASKRQSVNFSLITIVLSIFTSVSIAQSTGIGVDPIEITTIETVWSDLFGDLFEEGSNAMFFRTDLPVQVDGEDGFEVAVLDVTVDDPDFADEYVGASFVEHSRYSVMSFHRESEFLQENGVVVYATVKMDAVSGTLHNAEGDNRIVAGWSYILELKGTGGFSDSSVIVENFVPMDRFLSIAKADARAVFLADIPEEAAIVDCSTLDGCEQQYCYCLENIDLIYQCAIANCSGFSDPGVIVAAGTAGGVAGAGIGFKASTKKGPWGTAIGTAFGVVVGYIAGGSTAAGIVNSQCRREAKTAKIINSRWASNYLERCLTSGEPYVCPVTLPCP